MRVGVTNTLFFGFSSGARNAARDMFLLNSGVDGVQTVPRSLSTNSADL